MVFAVVMYRCESWTIKKAEHQRIDTFQIVVLEKTLGNLLDCKEIKLVNHKGPPVQIRRGERAQRRGCRKTSVFLSRETGISGNFLGRIRVPSALSTSNS